MAIFLFIKEWAGNITQKELTSLANSWDNWAAEETGYKRVWKSLSGFYPSCKCWQLKVWFWGERVHTKRKEASLLLHPLSLPTEGDSIKEKKGQSGFSLFHLWHRGKSSSALLLLCFISLTLGGPECLFFPWWKIPWGLEQFSVMDLIKHPAYWWHFTWIKEQTGNWNEKLACFSSQGYLCNCS